MMFIEPTHYLAPFWQCGSFHYAGGMLTACLPIALGWYTFLRIPCVFGLEILNERKPQN
jgi:hypothetical protein